MVGAAEGGDEERHGDESHLPEGVVEEEVERDEDAEHRDLLEQEERVEETAACVDGSPGDENTERGEEAGEDDEPHGEAVDAEVIVDGGRGDPGDVLLELKATGSSGIVEVGRQVEREQEGDQGDGEGAPLLDAVAVRQEREKDGSCEWDEG